MGGGREPAAAWAGRSDGRRLSECPPGGPAPGERRAEHPAEGLRAPVRAARGTSSDATHAGITYVSAQSRESVTLRRTPSYPPPLPRPPARRRPAKITPRSQFTS